MTTGDDKASVNKQVEVLVANAALELGRFQVAARMLDRLGEPIPARGARQCVATALAKGRWKDAVLASAVVGLEIPAEQIRMCIRQAILNQRLSEALAALAVLEITVGTKWPEMVRRVRDVALRTNKPMTAIAACVALGRVEREEALSELGQKWVEEGALRLARKAFRTLVELRQNSS